jgi:hypothetical protein
MMQGCGSQYGPFLTSVADGCEDSVSGPSRFTLVEENLASTR